MVGGQIIDFHGHDFEGELSLFGDEFPDLPAVYIIYTSEKYLEISETSQLKTKLETHENTQEWVKHANGKSILIAFHLDLEEDNRKEKVEYLKEKLKPIL